MLSKSITTGKYYWNGAEITEAEYSEILTMLRNRPEAPDGYGYRLTENLEWELYELPVEDVSEEISAEQALAEIVEVLK